MQKQESKKKQTIKQIFSKAIVLLYLQSIKKMLRLCLIRVTVMMLLDFNSSFPSFIHFFSL